MYLSPSPSRSTGHDGLAVHPRCLDDRDERRSCRVVTFKLNARREDRQFRRERLEHVYRAFTGFCRVLRGDWYPYIQVMTGKLNYNQALDMTIASGKGDEHHLETLGMLVAIYWPKLQSHVDALKTVRDDGASLLESTKLGTRLAIRRTGSRPMQWGSSLSDSTRLSPASRRRSDRKQPCCDDDRAGERTATFDLGDAAPPLRAPSRVAVAHVHYRHGTQTHIPANVPGPKPGARRAGAAKPPLARSGQPSAVVDTRVVYCGDCLDQLRKLPDGCVDLIYIDRPFNSNRNRNYEVFWGRDAREAGVRGPPRQHPGVHRLHAPALRGAGPHALKRRPAASG